MAEFVRVITYLYEDAKEKLVGCADNDTHRFRGEAQAYKRLIDMLTRDSMRKIKS